MPGVVIVVSPSCWSMVPNRAVFVGPVWWLSDSTATFAAVSYPRLGRRKSDGQNDSYSYTTQCWGASG